MFRSRHEKKKDRALRKRIRQQQQQQQGNSSSSSSAAGAAGEAPLDGDYVSDFSDNDGMDVVPAESFALRPFSYADLWAPLRFAVPATHTIEEECSPERLDGDAELIGEGRMGPVYRQTLQGHDCAVKLAIYSCEVEIDHQRMYPTFLRDEMFHEKNVYGQLRDLQGKTIPRLLWYGDLVERMADALVTEYSGEAFPHNPSAAQAQAAIAALHSLHDHGVSHGDVALKNFVCKRDSDQVMVLDFGFSDFREEFEESRWQKKVATEKQALREQLGLLTTSRRAVATDKKKKEPQNKRAACANGEAISFPVC
jgi:hypothetical protein